MTELRKQVLPMFSRPVKPRSMVGASVSGREEAVSPGSVSGMADDGAGSAIGSGDGGRSDCRLGYSASGDRYTSAVWRPSK